MIETERLSITPQSIEEIKSLQEKESDPEMKKAYSEMLDVMLHLNGCEEWGSDWEIRLRTGETVGEIGFKGAPDAKGMVEIGYGIDKHTGGQVSCGGFGRHGEMGYETRRGQIYNCSDRTK